MNVAISGSIIHFFFENMAEEAKKISKPDHPHSSDGRAPPTTPWEAGLPAQYHGIGQWGEGRVFWGIDGL